MPEPRFATKTTISPEKSQQELMAILRKYGADKLGTMEDRKTNKALLYFQFKNLDIEITLSLPSKGEFARTDGGKQRTAAAQEEAWQQAIRSRYRVLVLATKAKLEAVECGLSTVEQEFLAFVTLPGGTHVGEVLVPRLIQAGKTGDWSQLQLTDGR